MRAYDDYMMARMMQGVTMQGGIGRVAFMSRQVKNAVRLMMMALVAMVTIGFTSCSKDDDDSNGGDAYVSKMDLYCSINDDVAELFDVTVSWYDANGQLRSQQVTPSTPVSLSFTYNMAVANKYGYDFKFTPKKEKLELGKTYNFSASTKSASGAPSSFVVYSFDKYWASNYGVTANNYKKTFGSQAEFENFLKDNFKGSHSMYQKTSTTLEEIK